MAQPNEQDEISYSFDAIELLDKKWDRFYDIWLELAEQHTTGDGRHVVDTSDIDAVLVAAVEQLISEENRVGD